MYEEEKKLTKDYEKLVERYDEENLITINNGNEIIKYPIICLGTGLVELNNKEFGNVVIVDDNNDIYHLPAIIENNFDKIFNIHGSSKLFDSLTIRVKNMSFEDNILKFETGRTTYFKSLVTNRASDYEFKKGISVRSLFDKGPKLTDLNVSKLSNHLGYNGFIESEDGYIVFVKRSKNVSIGKGTYGDSIGASLKTEYALDNKGNFTVECLKRTIIREINDELKIQEEELYEDSIRIIAIYRDCVECGKPQFIMYAKAKNKAFEITKNFNKEPKSKNLNDKNNNKDILLEKETTSQLRIDQINLGVMEDGSKLLWIKRDDLMNHIIYDIQGIRLDEKDKKTGFLDFNKYQEGKLSKIKHLNMLPSAAASVWLFAKYLDSSENNND